MKNRKAIIIIGIVIASIICLITSFIILQSIPTHEYTYKLSITADQNQSYILIISIPEGWSQFSDSLTTKSGDVDFLMTDINGQPSLNVTGKGNTSLVFSMKNRYDLNMSYVKNWYSDSTTKIYLKRTIPSSISIRMENIHTNSKTNYWERYLIKDTLSSDGWQYVLMKLAQS